MYLCVHTSEYEKSLMQPYKQFLFNITVSLYRDKSCYVNKDTSMKSICPMSGTHLRTLNVSTGAQPTVVC